MKTLHRRFLHRLAFGRRFLAVAATLLLATFPARAHAAFLLMLQQVGTSVTLTGSGSLNTIGLPTTNSGNETFGGAFGASSAFALAGTGAITYYTVPTLGGPTSFGTSMTVFTTTASTGNPVGIQGNGSFLYLPTGYASGSALVDSSTFANQTFATLGFTPGTYSYALPSGDTFVVTGVPEPSTWALLGLGVAGLLGFALRHRRARPV